MRKPIERQNAIWAWIRRGEQPDVPRLQRRLQASRSTVRRDLEALRDLGAPISYDEAVGGYVTDDPNWTPPAGALDAVTTGQTGAIAGATARALVEAWNPLLAAALRAEAGAQFDRVVMVTTTRGAGVDIGLMTELCRAIRARRQISFRFRSPWVAEEAADELRRVSPWLMHLDDGHAYLRGWCHDRDALRSFHIGGIAAITTLGAEAKRPWRDLRKRLADRVGIGGAVEGEKVATVRLFGGWARWAARERWHPAQRDRWLGDVLERSFPYGLEIEVVRRLLGGGGDVEVVGPRELREAFASEVERAWRRVRGVE